MSINERTLVKAAWLARERAYAPYSHFKVGAVIVNEQDQIFSGCNVENASYGGTVCAERIAIFKAVSEGALKPGSLKAVVVAAESDQSVAPCGFCRQIIEEFAGPETEVLLSIETGKVAARYKHSELLPYSFNKSHLETDQS